MTSFRPSAHIIGRGIIGLSIGYRLLKAGWRITFVGPANKPGTASVAAVGVSAIKGVLNPRKPLFSAKIAGHHNLSPWLKELEADSGLSIPNHFNGAYEPYQDMMGYEAIRDRVFHRMHTGCYRVDVLSRKDLEALGEGCPLSLDAFGDNSGSFFYPEDGWFDPQSTLAALELIHRKSGSIFIEEAVERVVPNENHGVSIVTERSIVAATEVIIAAGIFSNQILENSGVSTLHQQAIHGQTLFGTDLKFRDGVIIRGKRSFASYANKFRFGSTSHRETTIDQTIADLSPDQNLASELKFSASASESLELQGVWGVRARLRDREPAVGEIPLTGGRRLWIALGFYKNGLQLADIAAKSLVFQLNNQGPSTLFRAFLPTRFGPS